MSSSIPRCRVALVGINHQRVAKVVCLLHRTKPDHETDVSSAYRYFSPKEPCAHSSSDLPKTIPALVEIEYLPCVATFDSYEDESGKTVRYLVKIEYHGEHGTDVRGKSLAPFFDEDDGSRNEVENPFPGIAAVAVGCGIDSVDDVDKIASFIRALSSSCRRMAFSDGEPIDESAGRHDLLVECIQCNAEYSSMKEENEAYRSLTEDQKKEATSKQSIGPGKMAKFVYTLAQKVIRQRWAKELDISKEDQNHAMSESPFQTEFTAQDQEDHLSLTDSYETMPSPGTTIHIPNPERIRYACKRCRMVLFGEDDLEDPPHTQSLHAFRKKAPSKSMQRKICANHFLANPLPWMKELNDMEGKLHCFKCDTKIGHYSWTGAQCSCGTWVTPAIMIPMSKVDEMLPIGSFVVDPLNVQDTIGLVRFDVAGTMSYHEMELNY
eukprot:CCRYP_010549-RA/>CCRYP_010549-RA protein AED:0.12 eAED:0.08 QI:0/-1/0/1/-1/1/1/0/436